MHLFRNVDARVEKVEIRQKAAQLDPRGDPSDVFALIPELLARKDLETVISLGRAFLKVRRYSNSLDVFRMLLQFPLEKRVQCQVAAFAAYSLNGLGSYEEALNELNELRSLDPGMTEKFWPALAFSYAHFKLGHHAEFAAWLDKAAKRSGGPESMELAMQLYPDLRTYLSEQSLANQEK